jgi:hypothetical protein
MKVVAFGGQIASGKDSCADYLVEKLNRRLCGNDYDSTMGMGWKRMAFGDGVKKVFMDAFGEDLSFVEKWKRDEEIPQDYLVTIRKALQIIGDDFRHIHPDVWVNLVFRHAPERVVISDVRYVSEALAVKKHGGVNVLLWRPGHENDMNHPSEAQVRPYVEYFKKKNTDFVSKQKDVTRPLKGSLSDFVHKIQEVLKVKKVSEEIYPENLFDVFLVSETLELLYDKIDEIVLPYVEKRIKT